MSKRQAEVLYRTSKYGTWQPCSIVIPKEVEDLREYVRKDLDEQGIKYKYIEIVKITSK